ncbi:MAG TPA: hypothetical protein PLJ27_11785 [Polyangiaceae bacterium]|nr:MAG: hypothetical protein BWY17_02057 [Deltaproteobacteria bacterium ADurb.Bin207]HNT00095.1 hypothetical protein [Polyangiaceae bacterium]HNZ24179.1 hypothetical protein [Polyangiaceae bacterium]HOD22536.1 hypothetical protein [Polyangiaceae bacterium]HOE49468.1 hypothetical protein [Polyangiaceae bacterium]
MNRISKWGLCVVLGFGVVAGSMVAADDAFAQKKKGGAAAAVAPAAPVDPPTVKNREGIEIRPAGLHWGMSSAQLIQFYERVIDRDYIPLYRKAQAGPQTARLDAAVANTKAAFRRSKVEFGNLPTGVDSTPLKGEYTYQNGESMMHLNRRGAGSRYFFFIQDKLWKIYDEVPLGEKRPLGPSYEEAVKRLATRYGVVGRVTQPDYAIGRNFMEVDWQDTRTHLRVLDRSGLQIVGVVYEDRTTLANLASLRSNKPAEVGGVDPDVEALIRPPSAAPGPVEEKDPKKKK